MSPKTNSTKRAAKGTTHEAKAPSRPSSKAPAAPSISAAGALQHVSGAPIGAIRPQDVLTLQRATGNRAVARLLEDRAPEAQPAPALTGSPSIQAKLMVGAVSDPYEREADQVAESVMRAGAVAGAAVPRHEQQEDEPVRRKALPAITPLVQRHHSIAKRRTPEEEKEHKLEEEENGVQRKASAGAGGSFQADSSVEQRLTRNKSGGAPLAPDVRSSMESHLGADFGRVRVHTGGEAVQLNRDLQAHAFTHGRDVYFGAGQYSPGSTSGRRLLAHELTHVVQQGAGKRVQRWPWSKKKPKKESYNVRMGEALPQTEEIGKERFRGRFNKDQMVKMAGGRKVDDAMDHLRNEGYMERMLAEAQEKAEAAGKPEPSHGDMLDFRLAFADALVEEEDMGQAQAAYLRTVRGKDREPQYKALLMFFSEQVSAFSDLTLRNAPELAPERKYLAPGLNLGDAYNSFITERQEKYKLKEANVSKEDKPAFAAALKTLPSVEMLLKKPAERQAPKEGWKDGGSLVDKIHPINDLVAAKKWMGKKRTGSATFRRRVQQVDQMVRIMVEPQFLSKIRKPTVNVHATAAQGFTVPWGYRANAGGGELDVSYDEATNVIAHEVGHVLEENLPMKRWHDIHMLLGERHRSAGGGATAVEGDTIFTRKSEGRYAGDWYTGRYTTTAYKGGNAEVVSMALQFLSKPKEALKLINNDPQHAALVLRAFQPAEYKKTAALRKFDKYLPTKEQGL